MKALFIITALWFVAVCPCAAYSAEVIVFNSSWGILSSKPFKCSIGPNVFNTIQKKQFLKFSLKPGKYKIICKDEQFAIRVGSGDTNVEADFEVKQEPVYIELEDPASLIFFRNTAKRVTSLPDRFYSDYQEIK